MNSLKILLKEALLGTRRVAILGCGSSLRGDDAVGPMIAEALGDLGDLKGRARAFNGDVAPENQTSLLKQFDPDLVLMIDAVDMGSEPGEVRLIPLDEIGGVSFSTHILPLSILMEYLKREIGCEVLLLGIQPISLEFMADMTPAVAKAVETVTNDLLSLLTQM